MRSKKTVVLVIAAIVALSAVTYSIYRGWRRKPEISSENLILNSSFEILKDDKLESWWQPPEGGWLVTEEGAYQGKRCMQATIAWSWLEQEIPIEPEQYYTLQVYVRSDITVAGKEAREDTFLTLECLNDKNEVIRREWGITTAVSSWQLRETSIYASAECEKIRIKLAKRQGGGSVWFDEPVLIAKKRVSGVVRNPGFEILKDNRPESWWQSPQGGWLVDEKEAYRGSRSMQATIAWSWLVQDIVVKPKKYYTLQAYVRSDITIAGVEGKGNTFLTLECLDKENEVIGAEWGVATAVSSWQLRETSIYASAECEKIRIKLAKREGGGNGWFDELELIAKPGYLRIAFIRRVLKDKPFWIFYSLLYLLLMVLLLRTILRSYFTCKKSRK